MRKLGFTLPMFDTAFVAPIVAQNELVAPDREQVFTPEKTIPSQLPQVMPNPGFKVLPAPLPQFPVVKPQPGSPADPSAPIPNQVD